MDNNTSNYSEYVLIWIGPYKTGLHVMQNVWIMERIVIIYTVLAYYTQLSIWKQEIEKEGWIDIPDICLPSRFCFCIPSYNLWRSMEYTAEELNATNKRESTIPLLTILIIILDLKLKESWGIP